MKRIAALILLASMTAQAMAVQPFVIKDIRVDGLNRIAAGTVYSYLPVAKGDQLTNANAKQSIQALFRTGFFSDVELDRQGNILVIKVVERPSIAKLNIRGNKAIKTKDLKKGLKHIGLSEGDTFDPLALRRVQDELVTQYYNRGKYNVSVKTHVTHLDRNRVNLDIAVREGKTARIKAINIVGNTTYSDKQIRKGFKSDTTNLLSWYTKDDQYSREKLSGDLKKLGGYYMNRGYADFNIDSTQVSISPNKRNMYISADIKEGEIYKISGVHLLGKLVLPEKSIRRLVFLQKGDTFSRYLVEQSKKAIKGVLSNIGYAFAKVQVVPKLDKDKRTADMTFYIKPGKRVYVRRINFHGNTSTEDSVLRREMRQPEGAWYSQAAIDASKRRLQTLGYFEDDVKVDTQRVPGTDDQVDLNVTTKEKSAGNLQFGVGYSQYSGIILNASVSQKNFMGTGNQFSVGVQHSSYYQQIQLGYLNPYLTDDGISIGYNATYSKLDYGNTDFANYTNSTRSFSTTVGVPISEVSRMQFGLGVSSNKINTFAGATPQSFVDYQNRIGNKTVHSWTGTIGYQRDTKNYFYSPTRGGVQSISLSAALPGSTVQYWKLFYHGNHYWPVGGGFVLLLDGNVGYGKTYGKDSKYDFPFWENYYAGGVRDVRGFQDNSLGPRERASYYGYEQPIGGSFKVKGTAQMFLPIPALKDVSTARIAAFLDVGNVYKDINTFNASDLRASVGLSLQWRAPIGPLVISVAKPIRDKPSDRRFEERIQFTFGNQF